MWGLAKSHFLPHYHRKIYKKSAVFHAQINKQYHEYHIRNVNSETLNLACVVKSCPARAHLRVPKSTGLITLKRTVRKTNGKNQKSAPGVL